MPLGPGAVNKIITFTNKHQACQDLRVGPVYEGKEVLRGALIERYEPKSVKKIDTL